MTEQKVFRKTEKNTVVYSPGFPAIQLAHTPTYTHTHIVLTVTGSIFLSADSVSLMKHHQVKHKL